MPISVMAWNICDRLADPVIQRQLLVSGVDIIVLLEAYPAQHHDSPVLQHAITIMAAVGYTRFEKIVYDDSDGRRDRHGMVVFVRDTLSRDAEIDVLRLGRKVKRNAVRIKVHGFSIIGVHLDDRQDSERIAQAASLLSAIAKDERVMILGDLNADYPDTHLGAVLRHPAISRLLSRLPFREPGLPPLRGGLVAYVYGWLAQLRSLISHIREMNSSHLLPFLQSANFQDAGHGRIRTLTWRLPFGFKLPVAEPDHIMVRGDVKTRDYEVWATHGGSDHYAVSATIIEKADEE